MQNEKGPLLQLAPPNTVNGAQLTSQRWQPNPDDHSNAPGRYAYLDCTSFQVANKVGPGMLATVALFTATIWTDSMRPIILNWAKGEDCTYPFRLSTWVLCCKAGVFILTCLIVLYEYCMSPQPKVQAPLPQPYSRLRLALLLIPSFAYVASDLLTFPALELTNAATFSVLRQSKLLITALMCRFALRRPVSALQWLAVLQLTLASSLFVADILDKSPTSGQSSTSESSQVLGLLLIACKCFCDAFAVTSQDVLFKHLSHEGIPFAEQQVACAFYMLLVALAACLYQDGADILRGDAFFSNYNTWAYLGLAHFSIYGVLVMIFLRYLDCMLKMLESTGSIALTLVWDVLWFSTSIGVVKWLASAFVLLSSALYMMGGLRQTSEDEVAKTFNAADRDRDGVLTLEEFRGWYVDPRGALRSSL